MIEFQPNEEVVVPDTEEPGAAFVPETESQSAAEPLSQSMSQLKIFQNSSSVSLHAYDSDDTLSGPLSSLDTVLFDPDNKPIDPMTGKALLRLRAISEEAAESEASQRTLSYHTGDELESSENEETQRTLTNHTGDISDSGSIVVISSDDDGGQASGSVDPSQYERFISSPEASQNESSNTEFFNNPPLLTSQQAAAFTKNYRSRSPQRIPVTPRHDNPVVIPETDSSSDEPIVVKEVPRARRRISSSSSSSWEAEVTTAEIKVRLNVKMVKKATSNRSRRQSRSDNEKPSSSKQNTSQRHDTPKRHSKTPKKINQQATPPQTPEKFINAEEEHFLKGIYGDKWQTPGLVKKMKEHEDKIAASATAFNLTKCKFMLPTTFLIKIKHFLKLFF